MSLLAVFIFGIIFKMDSVFIGRACKLTYSKTFMKSIWRFSKLAHVYVYI